MKKIIKIIFTISSIFTIISTVFTVGYVLYVLNGVQLNKVESLKNKPFSTIYDKNLQLVETIGKDKKEYIEYEDLPPLLINALVSIEDKNFFTHHGVDPKRTLEAFIHNMFSNNKHGGSTITQQLVKNIMLSDEQTYERKIQEAYLAIKLENEFSKEEIITLYFNCVYFEQTTPGVVYAARHYFDKELDELTLPEIAILVGVVKSASYYNPLKYPTRTDERKNLVLKNMYEDGYISQIEYDSAIKIPTSSLVNIEQSVQLESFRYQAYLDVVYLEVEELIGKNPLIDRLEIYTYLDSSLQTHLDEIQKGNVIEFSDETQQIAATVVNNETGAITGIIGGRNYNGSHLFNRAYSMQRQPASSIKPVFEYALACEYLNYTNATTVIDEPYTYPGSQITVQNADKKYLGKISMEDALGYSKNTSALYTLENVIRKIGNDECINYLNSINLMDQGPFTYAYGIGGMSYGVSTTQLAGAYAMLARNGNYLKPSTIYMIKDAETHEVLYQRKIIGKQIISKQAAYKVASTLVNIVNKNYNGIGEVKVPQVEIGAKTGTNGYDSIQAKNLNFPSYADKDSWLAGFSPTYSMAVWSGWDIANKDSKEYFGRNDTRRKIPKRIFRNVMEKINLSNEKREMPSGLVKVNIVKGVDGYYLANKYIPSNYIMEGIFNTNEIPSETLPDPKLGEIKDVKLYYYNLEINGIIIAEENPVLPFNYENIFGSSGYEITYLTQNGKFASFFTTSTNFTIYLDSGDQIQSIHITPKYEKNSSAFANEFVAVEMANEF